MIHSSHTRRDIIDIIETFNFPIKYKDVDKNVLFQTTDDYINKLKDLDESVDDLIHIKTYLSSINQNKIKINDRDKYIDIAKNIIFYVKNGCLLSYTTYLCEEELKRDIRELCKFCSLPTVLRAVNMINNSHKFSEYFEPILNGKTKVLLRKRQEKKLKKLNNLRVRTKAENGGQPFIIYFD